MIRWSQLYPVTALVINLLLGVVLYWFVKVCTANYEAMGFALPLPTVWALRWPYFCYFLAALAALLLYLSLMGSLSDRSLFSLSFGIVVIDAGMLLIAALGYVMPYLTFPVTID